MSRGPCALGLVGVAGSLIALATVGYAQRLEMKVISVYATDRGSCDPSILPLRARLRRLVGYNAFQVVREEERLVSYRSPVAFSLPGGRSLHVLPKGMDDERVMMQVRLLDGRRRLVDTHVRLRNQGTVAFGVGRDGRASDEGALIILLRAGELKQ